jgi:hypothetical protein
MNELNSFSTTNPYKIKHPTQTERNYNANVIIYVDHRDGVFVAKNRYGPTGKVDTEVLVDILTITLAEQVFDGRTVIFQEGMKQKFEKAINKIIKEG